MSELRFHLDGLRDASGRIGRVFNRLDGSGDDTRHSGRIIDGDCLIFGVSGSA